MSKCKRRGIDMSIFVRSCVAFMLICTLSGCSKIVEWGHEAFYQGEDIAFNKDLINRYIKMVSVHDQITTVAKFDVLWLGDEIRTEYAKLHTRIAGKSDEQYQALLRRQLEENNHFITFYVLSIYDNPLGDPESNWHVSLRINNKEFAPTEIKVIELAPEYLTFLGEHFSRFRVPYRVMFDAKDFEEAFILREETETIEMYFRSTQKQVSLVWNIDKDNKVVIPVNECIQPQKKHCVRRKKVCTVQS